MKFNILLSILFAIVTSFAAIHEVKHIEHNDASSCLICTVNNNIVSDDAVTSVADIQKIHFENIEQHKEFFYLQTKINFNQNRAPPKFS
ncbi:MAG: hypothetical protein QG559_1331 [Campylobacterota bacterium]|nr:hypothetical protein [Campylobacterota bacterium]